MATQIRGGSQIIANTVSLDRLVKSSSSAQLIVGKTNSDNPTWAGIAGELAAAMTGSTLDLTINNNAVTTAKIADANVTPAKVSFYNSGSAYWDFATSSTNRKLTGIADPTASNDAATKAYVDGVAQGLDIKQSCRLATTANINLSTIGLGTIDGVQLVDGNRVLVKNQTTTSENGIYVAKTSAWTRALDADAWAELPGAFTFIEEGNTLADTGWVCTVNSGGTLGSTAITFTQFSGAGAYSASAPIVLTGTTFSFNHNSTSFQTASNELQLKSTVAGNGIALNSHVLDLDLTSGTPLKITATQLDFGFNSTSFQVTSNSLELKSTVASSTGGLTLSSNALSIKLNGSTLGTSADGLKVSDGGITTTQVASTTLKAGNMNISGSGAKDTVLTYSSTDPGWQWSTIASLVQATLVTNVMATGSAKVWTIGGSDSVIADTEAVYVNGIRQRRTTDYAISGTGNRTITFVDDLNASDLVLCDYQK